MPHPIVDFQTHFLLPFQYCWHQANTISKQLKAMRWNGNAIWEDAPNGLPHLDNILPTIQLADTIIALQMTTGAADFMNLAGESFEDIPHAKLCDDLRAIIYLTHYGTGVFMISLKPTSQEELTAEKVMKFNHFHHWGLTSQYSVEKRRPRPMLSIGKDSNRLSLPLIDLIHQLLPLADGPCNRPDSDVKLAKLQRGLSVYTSLLLERGLDFKDVAVREAWIAPLAKLQRVMLPDFSDVSWDSISENVLRLNDRHWMCLGHLGAAHLIADQSPQVVQQQPFRDHRFQDSLRKMFLPYLLALLQRLSLQVFNGEAIAAIDLHRDKPEKPYPQMESLRTALMDFTLRFQPDLLTNEDNGVHIYRQAQRALGVHDTQQRLHRALADVDSQRIARHQSNVQHNIHWLELFIFTVYVVELTTHLSHAFGGHDAPSWFTGWGLVIVIAAAIVTAALQLKLKLLHEPAVDNAQSSAGKWQELYRRFEKRWLIMALIGLVIWAVICIEKQTASREAEPNTTPGPPTLDSKATSHPNVPLEVGLPGVSLQLDPALQPLKIRVSPADRMPVHNSLAPASHP